MAAQTTASKAKAIAAALVQKFTLGGAVVAAPDACAAKLAALLEAGGDELTLIMDFDRTITSADSTSAHGVLPRVMSKGFRDTERLLFKHYYPIEQDLSMPLEKKIPLMEEWYQSNHTTMIQEHLDKNMIADAVKGARDEGVLKLRDGAAAVLDLAFDRGVKTQILSAGLKDVIEVALRYLHRPLPKDGNATIISNAMEWHHKYKYLVSIPGPLIHMYNKSQRSAPGAGPLGTALVVGDSLGDATMADGAPAGPTACVKVGLLNAKEPTAEAIAKYAAAFDVVILDSKDPTLAIVREICDAVVGDASAMDTG